MQHRPTLYRDPLHCPDENIGGAAYWVEYLAEPVGIALSCWTLQDGVHWEVIDRFGRRFTGPFDTLQIALAFLMKVHGWKEES